MISFQRSATFAGDSVYSVFQREHFYGTVERLPDPARVDGSWYVIPPGASRRPNVRRRFRTRREAAESLLPWWSDGPDSPGDIAYLMHEGHDTVRVDGGAECPTCGAAYRKHPSFRARGFDSFARGCDGEILKL